VPGHARGHGGAVSGNNRASITTGSPDVAAFTPLASAAASSSAVARAEPDEPLRPRDRRNIDNRFVDTLADPFVRNGTVERPAAHHRAAANYTDSRTGPDGRGNWTPRRADAWCSARRRARQVS